MGTIVIMISVAVLIAGMMIMRVIGTVIMIIGTIPVFILINADYDNSIENAGKHYDNPSNVNRSFFEERRRWC